MIIINSNRNTHYYIFFVICYIIYLYFAFFVKFNYFENKTIDNLFLGVINSRFRSFLYALPLFTFCVILLLKHLKDKSSWMHILFFTIAVISFTNKIVYGIIMLLNTNDVFSPNISTFHWNSYGEFKGNFEDNSKLFTIILNSCILGIVLIWYFINNRSKFVKLLRTR